MGPFDEAVFHAINKGWSSPLLDPLFVIFSQATLLLWVRIVLGLAALVLIIKKPTLRAPILLALVAFVAANGATDLLKSTWPMNRPLSNGIPVHLVYDFLAKHREIVLTSSGTASAHSANTSAIAVVFLLYFGRRAWLFVLISLLTGFSRIYVGAHYPSQVLFGWITGALIAAGFVLVYRSISARRQQTG